MWLAMGESGGTGAEDDCFRYAYHGSWECKGYCSDPSMSLISGIYSSFEVRGFKLYILEMECTECSFDVVSLQSHFVPFT